jgi:hypothetical protein
MTREEAKFKRVGDFNIVYTAVNLRIDEIYDYFESKSCHSCRYGKELLGDYMCTNGDMVLYDRAIDVMCNLTFPKDFGCNKWENKND